MALSQEEKEVVDNKDQLINNTNTELPYLDISNPCIEQLTKQAIAEKNL